MFLYSLRGRVGTRRKRSSVYTIPRVRIQSDRITRRPTPSTDRLSAGLRFPVRACRQRPKVQSSGCESIRVRASSHLHRAERNTRFFAVRSELIILFLRARSFGRISLPTAVVYTAIASRNSTSITISNRHLSRDPRFVPLEVRRRFFVYAGFVFF